MNSFTLLLLLPGIIHYWSSQEMCNLLHGEFYSITLIEHTCLASYNNSITLNFTQIKV